MLMKIELNIIKTDHIFQIIHTEYQRQKIKYFSCFYYPIILKVPKYVRLNTTHFFIAKIPNKRELQQIAINNSSDINTKDFVNIYRKYTAESYSFLVNDTTLESNNHLRFRKNLFGIKCKFS